MAETYQCSKVKRSCQYCSVISGDLPVCNYILMEHQRRGCPPEECDKYKPRTRKRRGGKNRKTVES